MNMYEAVKQPERKEEIAAARNEVKKYRIAANEIECIDMAGLPSSPVISDEPRCLSHTPADAKLIDRIARKDELADQMATIEERINAVDDGTWRGKEFSMILRYRYIEGLRLVDMMNAMSYSKTNIKLKTNAALIAYYAVMKADGGAI